MIIQKLTAQLLKLPKFIRNEYLFPFKKERLSDLISLCYHFKLKEEKESWARRFELLQLDFVSASESYDREMAKATYQIQELEAKNSYFCKEIDRLNGLLSVFEKEDDAMAQELK